MIDKINEMAEEMHENAVNHGFWNVEDVQAVSIGMLHCELSEALQAERSRLPMFDYQEGKGKPEGVAVELADFVIRLMDWAAGNSVTISDKTQRVPVYKSLVRMVNELHGCITQIGCAASHMMCTGNPEDVKKLQGVMISNAIESVEQFLKGKSVDLWAVVKAKMDYNRSRPFLHGKAY